MSNDIPEPWTEVATRADTHCVNGKFPTTNPKWQELVNHFDTINARDGTDKVSKNMIRNRRNRATQREAESSTDEPDWVDTIGQEYRANAAAMQEEMNAVGFGEPTKKTRARHIPGAQARLDARYDDTRESPLDAPETHADRERLREHLTRHPSVTGPESAGR